MFFCIFGYFTKTEIKYCSKFNIGMVDQNSDYMDKVYALFYLATKKGKCLLLEVSGYVQLPNFNL